MIFKSVSSTGIKSVTSGFEPINTSSCSRNNVSALPAVSNASTLRNSTWFLAAWIAFSNTSFSEAIVSAFIATDASTAIEILIAIENDLPTKIQPKNKMIAVIIEYKNKYFEKFLNGESKDLSFAVSLASFANCNSVVFSPIFSTLICREPCKQRVPA